MAGILPSWRNAVGINTQKNGLRNRADSVTVEPAVLAPIQITSNNGNSYRLCLEKIAWVDNGLAVLGWTDAPSLRIEVDGKRLAIELHARDDVTATLNLAADVQPGFAAIRAMTADQSRVDRVTLTITLANCYPYVTAELAADDELERYEILRLPRSCAADVGVLATTPVGTPAWHDLRQKLPAAVRPPAGVQGYLACLIRDALQMSPRSWFRGLAAGF